METGAEPASVPIRRRPRVRLVAKYDREVLYPYEGLSDSQFENLVVEFMRALFGIGVQSFSTGPDGGRDALFVGTAERFPSTAAPWVGTTVGQAKHTLDINVHFSDPSFSGDNETSVLSKEAVRVKKLVEAGAVDNYVLFANRRLGGVTAPKLVTWLAQETSLSADRIYLCGVEYMDALLRNMPELIQRAAINPIDGPLLVSSYDLAEVILAIAQALGGDLDVPAAGVTSRVSYNEKNVANNMSPEFAKQLSRNYMRFTEPVESFLADPANTEARRKYEACVEEFQLKVIEKRADFTQFDSVFNHLVELMVGRDPVLARNSRLLRALLFYMYWHCDLGETPDADAE